MSKLLKILKEKNTQKQITNHNIKINDIVTLKKISGEFKNNVSTITGTCIKIQQSSMGVRVTLKTILYDEVVFQSFLLNSPSIIKINNI